MMAMAAMVANHAHDGHHDNDEPHAAVARARPGAGLLLCARTAAARQAPEFCPSAPGQCTNCHDHKLQVKTRSSRTTALAPSST